MKGCGIRAWRVLEVGGARADADGCLHSKFLPSRKSNRNGLKKIKNLPLGISCQLCQFMAKQGNLCLGLEHLEDKCPSGDFFGLALGNGRFLFTFLLWLLHLPFFRVYLSFLRLNDFILGFLRNITFLVLKQGEQ